MKLVSLNCRGCSAEMAKLRVPVDVTTTGESSVLCIPCADKARQMKLKKLLNKAAVIC